MRCNFAIGDIYLFDVSEQFRSAIFLALVNDGCWRRALTSLLGPWQSQPIWVFSLYSQSDLKGTFTNEMLLGTNRSLGPDISPTRSGFRWPRHCNKTEPPRSESAGLHILDTSFPKPDGSSIASPICVRCRITSAQRLSDFRGSRFLPKFSCRKNLGPTRVQ